MSQFCFSTLFLGDFFPEPGLRHTDWLHHFFKCTSTVVSVVTPPRGQTQLSGYMVVHCTGEGLGIDVCCAFHNAEGKNLGPQSLEIQAPEVLLITPSIHCKASNI
jgi:hypothetical protein